LPSFFLSLFPTQAYLDRADQASASYL